MHLVFEGAHTSTVTISLMSFRLLASTLTGEPHASGFHVVGSKLLSTETYGANW